jgi:sulfopyruvate decarboxylase TPP-binding subunit
MSLQPYAIPASIGIAALQRNKIDHVVTVPDWVQLSLHNRLDKGVDGIKVINCCNENQTVTVAAGLTIGGKRPLVMMQNQGLYNCFNSLRAVCLDAHVPMVFMVGQFGFEFDRIDKPYAESGRTMVRIMEPFLKAIEVPFHCLDSASDMIKMDEAYAQAESLRTAVVLLVRAPMAWN